MIAAYNTAPQNDDLQGEQIQCMYSQTHPSQQCAKIISKHDLEWAKVLRQTLGVCPPRSPTFRHILEEYSRTYLCRHHRDEIDVHHNEYWQGKLDQWTDDLKHHLRIEATQHPPLQTDFTGLREIGSSPTQSSYKAVPKHRPASSAPTSPRLAKHSLNLEGDSHRRNKSESNSNSISHHSQPGMKLESSPMPTTSFREYRPSNGVISSFEDVVTSPLAVAESKSGYIYAYKRVTGDIEDQRYIRIGISSQRLDDQVHLWSHQCQYFLELVCPCVRVRNAARIEALLHKELELSQKRRCDIRCKMDPKRCQTTHDNWFEIEITEAESVIQHWASWMETYNPYDNNGHLQSELLKSIREVRPLQQGTQKSFLPLDTFHRDSKGRIWHNVRQKTTPPTMSTSVSPSSTRPPHQPRSRKASLRNKPIIPQRQGSLNLGGARFYSPSVPDLPLKSRSTHDLAMPSPKLPRRKTSVNLRAKYTDEHHDIPLPTHQPTRSKSLASFHTQSNTRPHTRFASIDNTVRSSSLPPSTRSLKRRNRNSSLRSLVSTKTSLPTLIGADMQIMEATVVRREKGRSIYIGAPTEKKISLMQDLSRIQNERS